MSNGASYDKALLDDVPEVTPQQRQRFYDADILYDDASHQRENENGVATLPAGAAPAARLHTDIEAGHAHAKEYVLLPPPVMYRLPWYKTRKGIIAIVVIIIVVIGAVVGGAVGGTQANKNESSSQPVQSQITITASSSSSFQGAGQGEGVTATGNAGQASTDTLTNTPSPSTTQGAQRAGVGFVTTSTS